VTALRLVIDEKPDPALRDAILKPLRAFNESKVGPITAEPLAITLRDPESDAVTGGLWGHSVMGWLFVDLLVVPEGLRGRGLGSSLIRKAEEIAIKRSCVGIWLYTITFQAPGFYQKMGFQRFGAFSDSPKDHDRIFYLKRLDG
jgi:GNAT superfamily N-acetyltransferase